MILNLHGNTKTLCKDVYKKTYSKLVGYERGNRFSASFGYLKIYIHNRLKPFDTLNAQDLGNMKSKISQKGYL